MIRYTFQVNIGLLAFHRRASRSAAPAGTLRKKLEPPRQAFISPAISNFAEFGRATGHAAFSNDADHT